MERGTSRRYPIGAELISKNETHFRVWAPNAKDVDLVLEESAEKNAKRSFHPLKPEEGGYFSGSANVGAGARHPVPGHQAENFPPAPAPPSQPHGAHGSACVVEPNHIACSDSKS